MGVRDAIAKAIMGIRAFHGSPHSFDKFDTSKIGTGEGAQVYGHGLYFAENPKVAHTYAENLGIPTIGGVPFDPKTNPAHYATDFWHNTAQGMGLSREEVAKMMEDDLGHMRRLSLRGDSKRIPFYEQLVDIFRSGRDIPGFDPNPGHRYEVNIKSDPARFLDWDKPLTAQSPQVQSAIEPMIRARSGEDVIWRHPSGEEVNLSQMGPEERRVTERLIPKLGGAAMPAWQHDFNTWSGQGKYRSMVQAGEAPSAASAALNEAGVPGIKYLDNFSRDAGQGTSNYVVFDTAATPIDILRKYGVAGAPAGALGATYDPSQYEATP